MDGQTPVRIEDRPTTERFQLTTKRSRRMIGPRLLMRAERLVIMAVCSQDCTLDYAAHLLGIGVRTLSGKLREYGIKPRKRPEFVESEDERLVMEQITAAPRFQEKALTPQTEVG